MARLKVLHLRSPFQFLALRQSLGEGERWDICRAQPGAGAQLHRPGDDRGKRTLLGLLRPSGGARSAVPGNPRYRPQPMLRPGGYGVSWPQLSAGAADKQ